MHVSISSRGTEFQVDFSKLHILRKHSSCPIVALTATLTKNDMELLSLRTGLISPHYVLVPVNRRNLYLLFLPSKQSHEVSKNVVVVCLLP